MRAVKWLLVAALALAASSAHAEEKISDIQLVSSSSTVGNGEPMLLGIVIETQPQWKTYWRSAGEGGLPPRLEWRRVENSSDPQLLWPAPQRFAVSGIESFGYTGGVIFPIRIDPVDPAKKLRLEVLVDYAVCLDICVPQQAELKIELPPGDKTPTEFAPLIDAAFSQVPKRQEPGTQPRIIATALATGDKMVSLEVIARTDRPFVAPELFVYAPGDAGADFLFGTPVIDYRTGRLEAQFHVPIQELNPNRRIGGTPVTLTLSDAGRAIDLNIVLGR